MFAAIRRASSRVSNLAARSAARLFVKRFAVFGQIFRADRVSKMRRKQRGIARFVSFCVLISHEHGRKIMGRRETVSEQLRPIGTITFASALLISGFAVGVPANNAFAVHCLTAPNSPAPPNGHWYYRTDRTQDRKCWYLQTDNGPSGRGAVQTARKAPTQPPQSVAARAPYGGPGSKDSVAQHGGAKLSDEDVEKLYTEFLEWERRAKN
jgi:hypothetical protein